MEDLPEIELNRVDRAVGFQPYAHDPQTLARPWALPGTPGLEHRIGGLEKANNTGNVSYDPQNHEDMVRLRQQKVDVIANELPPAEPFGDSSGQLLVISWGGTYGAVRASVERARDEGYDVSHLHLRYLNPFPANLGELLVRYQNILVPELNLGQLSMILRGKFLVDTISLNKVQGKPFTRQEVYEKITGILKEKTHV